MQKALFWIEELRVTQGMYSNFSHQGVAAIDISAKCKYVKAPFDCVVKKTYYYDHEVWIQSLEPVEFADGTIDYMTILTMHDEDISNIQVGKVFKQGEIYYHPGNFGKSTGAHLHITCGKGKFSNGGWYKNQYGQWCITNQYDINKALFLHPDVKVTNDGGYKWVTYKKEDEPMTVKEREEFNALKKDVEALKEKNKVYHYWTDIKNINKGSKEYGWAYKPLKAMYDAGMFSGSSPSDLNVTMQEIRTLCWIAALAKALKVISY